MNGKANLKKNWLPVTRLIVFEVNR